MPVAMFLAVLLPSLYGQTPPAAKPRPGDEMIEKYLAAKTDELSKRELDGAATLAEWQQHRPRLRQEYFYMLGLSPMPEKTPLHPTFTGTLEHEGVLIEKLHFQSRPHLYVTGNLYRPKEIHGKLPAILYVCGHSDRGRDGNKSAYQDHGMWFASNGYICLMIDTLQLGEIRGIHHGTYKYDRWWWHAAGYTPAGVECWNGVRAIDYLVSRPDVDAERIGVTGISGGGAATFWIAAADERVKCAVPVSGMSDLESYVKHKVINGHCDCMFLYNTYQWDWTTIAALIAPRPLLFANSDNDKIFPMDGNRRVIAKLRKLYAMCGKPELVDEYVSQGGHAYRPDLRIAVFKWLNKYVKNDTTTPVKDADFKLIPGKELRVFAEDKDLPADQINTIIDQTFVPRANTSLPGKATFATWQKNLINEVRTRAFHSFLQSVPAATLPKGQYEIAIPIKTAPGIECLVINAAHDSGERFAEAQLIVQDAKSREEVEKLVVRANKGKFFGVCPRGGYAFDSMWTSKSPPNYVERSHALLGETVDQGRVWDIIATVRCLNKHFKRKRAPDIRWKVVGMGQGGILAAYAALLEPTIKEVVIFDPPTSHKQGPIFFNILRVLDIPEALGLLAPRPLTLTNARDPAFERTEEIYRLAGAADKFQRK
jgi:cephalosporin-C deacetylase-like acetyl esterase